ncbi:MAG: hypothetical protein DMG80_03135 [Acidobacteria bacterium]|nr:MAG: hypothetical protein DMG80_03135 [Acidobacteriota bacterium]
MLAIAQSQSLDASGGSGNSITVSGHLSDDIHPKTLKSILTQAGLKK